MATVVAGTQFITYNPTLDLQERRSAGPNAKTQVYTIEDIVGSTTGLTQTSTNAPVVTVLEDTIGLGTLVPAYDGIGSYSIPTTLDYTKTSILIGSAPGTDAIYSAYVWTDNGIYLESFNLNGSSKTFADGLLLRTTLLIEQVI
jgi:hypothetical protein